jgi:hypothetical protein
MRRADSLAHGDGDDDDEPPIRRWGRSPLPIRRWGRSPPHGSDDDAGDAAARDDVPHGCDGGGDAVLRLPARDDDDDDDDAVLRLPACDDDDDDDDGGGASPRLLVRGDDGAFAERLSSVIDDGGIFGAWPCWTSYEYVRPATSPFREL